MFKEGIAVTTQNFDLYPWKCLGGSFKGVVFIWWGFRGCLEAALKNTGAVFQNCTQNCSQCSICTVSFLIDSTPPNCSLFTASFIFFLPELAARACKQGSNLCCNIPLSFVEPFQTGQTPKTNKKENFAKFSLRNISWIIF